MTQEYKQLLELVKAGMWKDYMPAVAVFEGCDWNKVLEHAKVQAVVGVAFCGVTKLNPASDLGATLSMNEMLYLKWLGLAAKIAQKYELHVRVREKVHKLLMSEDIEHVWMKGLVCGERYAEPSARTCGDIDFLVKKEDFGRTQDALEKIGEVNRTLVHEHHGMAHVDGVQLEPHYKLHNFQNTKNDRTMVRLSEEWLFKDVRMPLEFEGMFLISHMVNHVYEEGLGLRQVVDFATFLHKVNETDGFDWDRMHGLIREMRMWKAYRLFVIICSKYLDVQIDNIKFNTTRQEQRLADKLMEDIMIMGNFGRGAYIFNHTSRWNEFKNYLWVLRRAWKMRFICPSEAICWPFAKLNRWTKKKKAKGGIILER